MLQSTEGNKGSCTSLSCAIGLPLETLFCHKKHMAIKSIDAMLSSGSVDELIEYLGLKDNLPELYSEEGAEHPIVSEDHSSPGLGCIERHLLVTHADLIAELQSKFSDDAEFPCCCCERLCRRTAVTCVDFSNLRKYQTAAG